MTDIVLPNSAGEFVVVYGQSLAPHGDSCEAGPRITRITGLVSRPDARTVLVCDLDQDGKDDAIIGPHFDVFTNRDIFVVVPGGVLPEVLDLDSIIDGTFHGGTLIFEGAVYRKWTGAVVGDVNGDGRPDFALSDIFPRTIGMARMEPDWTTRVIFGDPRLTAEGFDFSSGVPAGAGFMFLGDVKAWDNLGRRISGLGDINGDGFSDFAISGDVGDGTILLLGREELPSRFDADTLPLEGVSWIQHADRLQRAGDVDGDGRDDFLVSVDMFCGSSSVALVLGRPADELPPVIEADAMSTLDAVFVILNDLAVTCKSSALFPGGDVDRDGRPEFLFAFPPETPLVYGSVRAQVRAGRAFFVPAPEALPPSIMLSQAVELGLAVCLEGGNGSELGAEFALLRDFDGDGASEILATMHSAEEGAPAEARIVRMLDPAQLLVLRPCAHTVWPATVAAGDAILIHGAGLGETEAVLIGSVEADGVEVLSSSAVQATVPEDVVPGLIDVRVVGVGYDLVLAEGLKIIPREPMRAIDLRTFAGPGTRIDLCEEGPIADLRFLPDIDGDGFPELAWIRSGEKRFWFLNGGADLPPAVVECWADVCSADCCGLAGGPTRLGQGGDVDGDGRGDLLVTYYDSGSTLGFLVFGVEATLPRFMSTGLLEGGGATRFLDRRQCRSMFQAADIIPDMNGAGQ
ncbi:MAG: hypothetical protein JXP34_11565 [Planctomycetes bacterium]|nr:hypothetical protein [Planctomycetota bacterium]